MTHFSHSIVAAAVQQQKGQSTVDARISYPDLKEKSTIN
jgi:hypothetical protein